jgi:KDO2-lipid IV(A) lauroyltransferase
LGNFFACDTFSNVKKFRLTLFYLEYLIFRAVAALINSLNVDQASRLAGRIGALLFRILKSRRKIALENLRRVFGQEKSEDQIQKIAEASMRNLVQVAFEFIRIPKIIKTREIQWEIRGLEHCQKALANGQGFMVTVSHFGNWELMGLAAAQAGLPLYAVARPVKNPYVYQYIKELRKRGGFYSIDKAGAARETIKLLKKNQMVAILIDQHERQGSVWVDFFGRRASTTSLPAALALKYKVPIIPTFFYRVRPDFFIHFFWEPFSLIQTGNYEADLVANTQQYIARIEEEIRKWPENWLWMHRRWREPKAS